MGKERASLALFEVHMVYVRDDWLVKGRLDIFLIYFWHSTSGSGMCPDYGFYRIVAVYIGDLKEMIGLVDNSLLFGDCDEDREVIGALRRAVFFRRVGNLLAFSQLQVTWQSDE